MKKYVITLAGQEKFFIEDYYDSLTIVDNNEWDRYVDLSYNAIPALILVLQKIYNDHSNIEVNVSAIEC